MKLPEELTLLINFSALPTANTTNFINYCYSSGGI